MEDWIIWTIAWIVWTAEWTVSRAGLIVSAVIFERSTKSLESWKVAWTQSRSVNDVGRKTEKPTLSDVGFLVFQK